MLSAPLGPLLNCTKKGKLSLNSVSPADSRQHLHWAKCSSYEDARSGKQDYSKLTQIFIGINGKKTKNRNLNINGYERIKSWIFIKNMN
jgi:hypothetical protein